MTQNDRIRVQIATAVAATLSTRYDEFAGTFPDATEGPAGVIADRAVQIATAVVSRLLPKKVRQEPADDASEDEDS